MTITKLTKIPKKYKIQNFVERLKLNSFVWKELYCFHADIAYICICLNDCTCFSVCLFLDALIKICQEYYDKVNNLESEKYDMEKEVEFKDYRVCTN